jgi:hypothetical protein
MTKGIGLIAAVAAMMVAIAASSPGAAQDARMNFADRRAVLINNAETMVKLSDFSFGNSFGQVGTQMTTSLKWTNAGQKDITAFEVVLAYFDPFNRPILGPGGSWMITGHDSANWAPLHPGETDGDGLRHVSDEPVYTAIVYVRSIRFADGTVWSAPVLDVEQRIKESLPELRDLSNVNPGAKGRPAAKP